MLCLTILQHKKDARTQAQKQEEFLGYLVNLANVTRSARRAKIARQTVYDWLESDDSFKIRFDKAVKIGLGVLEDEATRRAVEGVLKPVYQKGKKVGTVREYSDTLLIVLLKAQAPEKYKDRVANELSGKNGEPLIPEVTINVISGPPLAGSEDEVDG